MIGGGQSFRHLVGGAQDAAKYPIIQRTFPHNKELSGHTISNAKREKHVLKGNYTKSILWGKHLIILSMKTMQRNQYFINIIIASAFFPT